MPYPHKVTRLKQDRLQSAWSAELSRSGFNGKSFQLPFRKAYRYKRDPRDLERRRVEGTSIGKTRCRDERDTAEAPCRRRKPVILYFEFRSIPFRDTEQRACVYIAAMFQETFPYLRISTSRYSEFRSNGRKKQEALDLSSYLWRVEGDVKPRIICPSPIVSNTQPEIRESLHY